MADERRIIAPPGREPQPPVGFPIGIDPVHPLHLAQRVRSEYLVAAVREQPELPGGELRQVLDRRGETGGRGDPTHLEKGQLATRTLALAGAVSGGETLATLRRRDLGARVIEIERIEDVPLHVLAVRRARRRRDDLARQRETQVRVLEILRGRVEHLLISEPLHDRFTARERELGRGPVRVVRLARQPGRVGEQPANRDRRRVRVTPLDVEPG